MLPSRIVSPPILEDLRHIFRPYLDRFGIKTFCATGSMILGETSEAPRDYDIAIIIDDLDLYLAEQSRLREALPKALNGVVFDFFIQLNVSGFFLNLDIFTMRIYSYFSLDQVTFPAAAELTVPDIETRAQDDLTREVILQLSSRVREMTPSEKPAQRWSDVVETWTLADRAMNFMRALTSGFLGESEADTVEFSKRMLSCHGNEHANGDIPACPSRSYSPSRQFHFCNDCGCGERELARISELGSPQDRPKLTGQRLKLHYRELACPRRRSGFSNAVQGIYLPVR